MAERWRETGTGKEKSHARRYFHRSDGTVFCDWDFLRSRLRAIEVGGGL
jgi:hypothetical protein